MDYGLHLAASGMLVNRYRQDVVANNLANVETAGFKPDRVGFQWRLAERLEAERTDVAAAGVRERLGGGVFLRPNRIDFSGGPQRVTEDPLHVAIRGDGFLRLEAAADETGPILTRDGRLALDADGRLVHAGTGRAVLDDEGTAIRLDEVAEPGRLRIDGDGLVRDGGNPLARLALVDLDDRRVLEKRGGSLFGPAAGRRPAPGAVDDAYGLRPASGRLEQGALEGSGTNPITALRDMDSASGAVSRSATLVDRHDALLDLVINRFGRVS